MGLACSPRVGEELALSEQPGATQKRRSYAGLAALSHLLRPYTQCPASEIWLHIRFQNFHP